MFDFSADGDHDPDLDNFPEHSGYHQPDGEISSQDESPVDAGQVSGGGESWRERERGEGGSGRERKRERGVREGERGRGREREGERWCGREKRREREKEGGRGEGV